MRIVDLPIEDAVDEHWIADLCVPARDWQLRGQDGREDPRP